MARKFKPKRLRKTHEQFLKLEELHDRAIYIMKVEVEREGCYVEEYGLERRRSKKWYYYDERPDFMVRCRGKPFFVEVKAKRVSVPIEQIGYTYINKRHVENYIKHSKEKKIPCWLYIVFFDDLGYFQRRLWFNTEWIRWGELEVKKAWDGNLVYVLPVKYGVNVFPLKTYS